MAKAKRTPAQEEDFGFVADEDMGFVPDEAMPEVSDEGFVSDMGGEYLPPEPFEQPETLPNLEMQQEAAKLAKKFGQGAALGFGEEAIAGIKTGSLSSPEYVTQRDIYRQELADIEKEYPLMAPLAEATGSTVTSAIIPFMGATKGARTAKEIGTAIAQGVGEAPTMEQAPSYAALSGGLQAGMEGLGTVARKMFADDPNKILSKSIGVKASDIKPKNAPETVEKFGKYGDTDEWRLFKELSEDQPEEIGTDASIVRSINNLDKVGFFKQGEKILNPATKKFARTKNSLEGFLKPQSLDDLANTASNAISSLKSRNGELLKNKTVNLMDIKGKLEGTIQDFTFDPSGHNAEAKYELAQDLKTVIYKDLKFYGSGDGMKIPASEVEMAKKRLDNYLKSPSFDKRTTDLGIDKQGAMKIRRAFDEILDNKNVGGTEYKKNNDMMHDLIRVKKVIDRKIDSSYVDTGSGMMDVRGWGQWIKESLLSPTYADIARSDVSKFLDTKVGQFGSGVLKRTPVEALIKDRGMSQQGEGRMPQSIGFSPRDVVDFRIPRDTKSILENKDIILAKLVQSGVPDEMVDTFSHALNEDPEGLSNAIPLIINEFPTLFQRSKYNVFDGKFINPNDRARAADEVSKRDDLNSIERARMINKINKSGEVPEGL